MKKILYTGLVVLASLSFTSCENFLDAEIYTQKDSGNVPTTVKDAQQMLTGVYSTLNKAVVFSEESHFYMSELASDERFGGGGENDKHIQGLDRLMNTKVNRFGNYWEARYQGIYRANLAINTMDKCVECSDDQKKQFVGEAYFLRALFYFELAQMFGEVPLVTLPEPVNYPKAPADDLFAQIASDLNQAISMMYNRPPTASESGHATKWAAQALMARVFLFYTGYYKKETLPVAGGTAIAKSQVVTWLEDCIANSGHGLVSDYRNLWPYSNEYTASNYKYAKDNKLTWANDGNNETVFAIKFSIKAAWGSENSTGQANQYALHFGLRGPNGDANTFPFGPGWGAGPVNSTLWNDWLQAEPNDIRRVASILNVNDNSEVSDFQWGADNQMEETGYWQKKCIPIKAYNKTTGALDISYSVQKDGYAGGDYQLCNTQDLVLIRFADVLLMHSELKQDATNLNKVRARAGLPAVAYSLDAIKKERRFELCFEGVRYFDIMRWGDAPSLLASQEGVDVKNKNVKTKNKGFGGGYKARYEKTGGFWPIPETQISLSGGVLIQNKGWGTPDAEYSGW